MPNVDKPPVIVELKTNADAAIAVSQIKERNYIAFLKDPPGEVLLMGLDYDDDTKKQTCIVESWHRRASIKAYRPYTAKLIVEYCYAITDLQYKSSNCYNVSQAVTRGGVHADNGATA